MMTNSFVLVQHVTVFNWWNCSCMHISFRTAPRRTWNAHSLPSETMSEFTGLLAKSFRHCYGIHGRKFSTLIIFSLCLTGELANIESWFIMQCSHYRPFWRRTEHETVVCHAESGFFQNLFYDIQTDSTIFPSSSIWDPCENGRYKKILHDNGFHIGEEFKDY